MIIEGHHEQQCLGWFREGGWETVFGPDIAHDRAATARANFRKVVLAGRLTRSLARLNPGVPVSVTAEAMQRCSSSITPSPSSAIAIFTAWSSPGSKWLGARVRLARSWPR